MENSRKTVLIVDDAKFIRDVLTENLSIDYNIITAENGKEAVLLFKTKNLMRYC